MDAAHLVALYVVGVAAAAWVLFRRVSLRRPWVGVINPRDVALMFAVVAVSPYLYLALPAWGSAVLASATVVLAVYFTLGTVGSSRLSVGMVGVVVVVAADVGTAAIAGERSNAFALVNGVVLALLVVGMAILFAQWGMRARDVAALAGALALYEALAGSQLTLMADLMGRVGNVPFVPVVGWWQGGDSVAIGFADLLLAVVFPLVARKAFGRGPGLAALLVSLVAVTLVVVLVNRDGLGDWPPMVVLGPLIVAQHFWWVHKRGRERAMWEYLRDEPVDEGADLVTSPFAGQSEASRPVEA